MDQTSSMLAAAISPNGDDVNLLSRYDKFCKLPTLASCVVIVININNYVVSIPNAEPQHQDRGQCEGKQYTLFLGL